MNAQPAGPHRAAAVVAGLAAAGAVTAAWSIAAEPRLFALRRVRLAVLRPGSWPLRVLHIADLHMLPRHRRKAAWVSALADLRPDLVVNTGDSLASRGAVPAAIAALDGLLGIPGAFVFGNNDFYSPAPKSPHRYFTHRRHRHREIDMPWQDLRAAQVERGWADVNNDVAVLTIKGQRVLVAGVNDPHTRRDHVERIAGRADPTAVVRIGVTHSPEPRVLDSFAGEGYELVLAGHTHGGQVRLPGIGALVTNCGLDRSRARGISRWGTGMWLNVSAGLGTSPFMPVRLACRPEATLLTLVAR